MADDMNRVNLVGRLTRDPELRQAGQTQVLSGRLAFTTRVKRGDEWSDEGNFVDVTLAFGRRAESLSRFLTKGSRIGVDGQLRWREWEDKSGQKRQAIDVFCDNVFLLDSRMDGQQQGSRVKPDIEVTSQPAATQVDDDELPF